MYKKNIEFREPSPESRLTSQGTFNLHPINDIYTSAMKPDITAEEPDLLPITSGMKDYQRRLQETILTGGALAEEYDDIIAIKQRN